MDKQKIGGNDGQVGSAVREGFWRCGQNGAKEEHRRQGNEQGQRPHAGSVWLQRLAGVRPIDGGMKDDHL